MKSCPKDNNLSNLDTLVTRSVRARASWKKLLLQESEKFSCCTDVNDENDDDVNVNVEDDDISRALFKSHIFDIWQFSPCLVGLCVSGTRIGVLSFCGILRANKRRTVMAGCALQSWRELA